MNRNTISTVTVEHCCCYCRSNGALKRINIFLLLFFVRSWKSPIEACVDDASVCRAYLWINVDMTACLCVCSLLPAYRIKKSVPKGNSSSSSSTVAPSSLCLSFCVSHLAGRHNQIGNNWISLQSLHTHARTLFDSLYYAYERVQYREEEEEERERERESVEYHFLYCDDWRWLYPLSLSNDMNAFIICNPLLPLPLLPLPTRSKRVECNTVLFSSFPSFFFFFVIIKWNRLKVFIVIACAPVINNTKK